MKNAPVFKFQLRQAETGNALFLILIAVALFAALSYAITQSSRGGGNISREQRVLTLVQFLDYGAALQSAITRMSLRGCTPEQLSFTYDNDKDGVYHNDPDAVGRDAWYNNVNAPADLSCHVFHPNGGGVTFQTRPSIIDSQGDDYIFLGNIRIPAIAGDKAELMLVARYVSDDLCLELNRRASIPTEADGSPPIADFANGPFDGEFDGTYNDGGDNLTTGPVAATWDSKYQGCHKTTGGSRDGNHLWYVILAR